MPSAACDRVVDILLERAAEGVPVLRVTAEEIARLRQEQDRISGNAIASAILRDPLMTLRVLRFLYGRRTRSQNADITTIVHAIMMLGQARFFREFEHVPVLEECLGGEPMEQMRSLMSRSRLAALFARDWAVQRHDIDPEEVMVAALLHDSAQLLLPLCTVPAQDAPTERDELRTRLLARLDVPGLVAELNDDTATANPRSENVRLAWSTAQHCHAGWAANAIRDDLARLQRLLRTSESRAWERLRRTALNAAREWDYYATPPAAALMPFVDAESAAAVIDDAGSSI